jgi:glycosyltransferase involved in cell wall biosynthesis
VRGAALQLISSGGVYGAERVVLELATHLKDAGLESHVVAIESPGAEALLELGRARALHTFKLPTGGRSPWSIAAALRDYMRQHRIAFGHAHGYKADLILWLARAGAMALVSTCHTWYRENLKMRLYERLDKLALRRFDHVVAVSPQLVEELAASGIRRDRISLIYNGTTIDAPAAGARDSVRRELGIAPDDLLITRLGRLSVAKGNDVLLRAYATLRQPRLRLLLAGDGEERANLERLTAELDIAASVVFAGYRSDVSNLLAATDLFVMSSIKEGLPIVMLEAMAANVPIVSTDVGAIGLVLQPARNAWLVPGGDARHLAQALSEAIERPDLRQRYAACAREDFAAKFSRKAMGDAYLELYGRVASTTPAGG